MSEISIYCLKRIKTYLNCCSCAFLALSVNTLLVHPIHHGDRGNRPLQLFFILFGGYKAKLLLGLVREEHAGACVCHDTDADEDARLGRDALVPSAKQLEHSIVIYFA